MNITTDRGQPVTLSAGAVANGLRYYGIHPAGPEGFAALHADGIKPDAEGRYNARKLALWLRD